MRIFFSKLLGILISQQVIRHLKQTPPQELETQEICSSDGNLTHQGSYLSLLVHNLLLSSFWIYIPAAYFLVLSTFLESLLVLPAVRKLAGYPTERFKNVHNFMAHLLKTIFDWRKIRAQEPNSLSLSLSSFFFFLE